MRLWVDVLDASGARLGEGPLTELSSASVSRTLDGAGSVSVETKGTRRALALLQNKRRMVVYVEQFGQVRELGRGIIDNITRSAAARGNTLSADGPDILGELKYANTLLARSYNQQSLSAIVGSLVGLASGWTATASGTDNLISARYDGASVLKALQNLVSHNGLHFRLGTAGKTLEVGALGTDAGVTLIDTRNAPVELYDEDSLALISSIKMQSASEELITWLLPLAGGQNADTALTLQYSNRGPVPYLIKTMSGPDGRTLYYLADEMATAKYGTIQKIGTYKEISPLSNTDVDIRAASNATYDAASATLDRYKEPQERFSLTVKKCARTIRPGDKVRIVYEGDVVDEDGRFQFMAIDGMYWVMKTTERIGQGGMTLDLDVASIDRYALDTAQVIIGTMEEVRLQGISVQPSYNRSNMGPYSYGIDNTHPITIPLKITNATFELDRCLLTIKSRPLRATATGAEGSPHQHVFASPDATYGGGFTTRQFRAWDPIGGVYVYYQLPVSAAFGVSYATLNETPDHTHNLAYGIYDDTLYPNQVSVRVDGVVVASGMGTASVGFSTELDITQELINAGLRREHEILIQCVGGRGEIEVQIELYDKITPFRLGV